MKKDMDSSVFGVEAKDTAQPSVEMFTPGPWGLIVRPVSAGLETTGYAHQVIIGNSEVTVANTTRQNYNHIHEAPVSHLCYRYTGIGRREPDITPHPNAALISAAPDLYAALLAAQEELRLIRMKDHCTIYNPVLSTQIALALQKAVPHTVAKNPAPLPNTEESKNNTGGTSDGGRNDA